MRCLGAVMGLGIGLALRNGLSSGGLDIVSITIRKNRKVDWFYFDLLQCIDRFVAGILFGWQYMFYSTLSIFVSGKVTDVVYTKQKKMQVMIVTKHPEKVVNEIQNCMRRGITIINEAEGAYKHDKQTVLMTIVTRYELPLLREAMKASDPQAFVVLQKTSRYLVVSMRMAFRSSLTKFMKYCCRQTFVCLQFFLP